MKYKTNISIELLLIKFKPNKWIFPVKKKKNENDRRRKTEEHMLIVMNKSTLEEHLSQSLQTVQKQFKIAVTFLTGYIGNFNVTDENAKFYFTVSINEEDFNFLTIPPGAYGIKSLNNEPKMIFINESYFTETDYPFRNKTTFSTLGSNIEI